MTVTYLGSLSVGGMVPGASAAVAAGIDAIDVALPNLQAQLDALNAFVPAPIDFTAQLSLANSMVSSINAAISGGLTPPDLAAQIAIIAAQIADVLAQLASVNANLGILTALESPLAEAGVHGYAFDGTVSAFGGELDAAIASSGVSGGSHANAVVLLTLIGATWTAMGQILKVTP